MGSRLFWLKVNAVLGFLGLVCTWVVAIVALIWPATSTWLIFFFIGSGLLGLFTLTVGLLFGEGE